MKRRFSETLIGYMKIVRGKIWRAGIYLRKSFRWQKIRPLVSKYGYYAGLALVLVILGTASASYRNRMEERLTESEKTEPVEVSAVITPAPTETPEPTSDTEPKYMPPLTGEILTEYSPDGLVWNDTLRQWQSHPALDIAGEPGESVMACGHGVVEDAYSDPLWGNVIVIRHEDGMASVYKNLGTLNIVSPGDSIKAGETISTVGKSACAEEDMLWHLHFEFRNREGESVDFMKYTGIGVINEKTGEQGF